MTQNITAVETAALTEVCAFCKKPLDGQPHEGESSFAIASYEPCDTCKEVQAKGITFFEVAPSPQQEGQPPIDKLGTVYPTGSWWVIPEAEVVRVLQDSPEALQSALKSRGIFLAQQEALDLGLYGDLTKTDEINIPVEGE